MKIIALKKIAKCGLACATIIYAAPAFAEPSLKIIDFAVEKNLKAGVPYLAKIKFVRTEKKAKIKEACFRWSGEGPFCFDNFRVNYKKGSLSQKLRTGNPGKYQLEVALKYRLKGTEIWSNIMETQ